MATRRGAQTRRLLADLRAAAEGDSRYVDLLLHLRRLTADFPAPVEIDHVFTVGGIEFVTAAAGQHGVPIRSLEPGASASVSDGVAIEGSGTLHAQVLLSAGGCWDLLLSRWAERPAVPHVLDLVESQVDLVRDFASWLRRYRQRRARAVGKVRDLRALMPFGNRGGGKTLVSLWLVLAAALEIPRSVCWFVVENRPASTEDVNQAFDDTRPERFAKWAGQPEWVWRLPNGSRIYHKSADDPKSLKAGRVDIVFINEAAKLAASVYAYATARIKDRGGLAILATNPPTLDTPKGQWVYNLWEKEREAKQTGTWFPLKSYHFDSSNNATIDRGADEDQALLIRAVSPDLAAADVVGEMVLPGDRIIYAFDKLRHGQRPAPELGDITGEFLRRHHRVGRAFSYLAGVDFQNSFPHIVVVFFKLYPMPDGKPMLWAVSDKAVKGSEDDFLDEVLHEGIVIGEGQAEEIDASTVLWIGDSSAQQQNSRHDFTTPPSFPAFLNRGLRIMSPTAPTTPKAKYGRNPSVGVSLGQVNSWLKVDRIMLSPLAPRLIADCRDGTATNIKGQLRPDKPHSHFLDCLRYVAWFVEPPTKRRPLGNTSAQSGGNAAFDAL